MPENNDVIQRQDNSPDTIYGPDHQQLNQTDQGSTDALNTSNTETENGTPLDQHPENSPGYRLLDAMWRTPTLVHQIGILDRQNHRFKNIPVKDAADALAQALKLSSEGTEVYFACAEYQTPDRRVAANASGACGFWMDIDCGEDKAAAGKGYPIVQDAEEALSEFCRDAGLPKPTHSVSSGGGLHAYWVVDGEIDRDTWQTHAKKLKGLTKARGFLADDSRTSDIASVLRVPGTLNHKYSPPRTVVQETTSSAFIECSVMLDAIDGAHVRLCSVKQPDQPTIATTAANPTGNADASQYGPPDLEKLSSALAELDADCDEATWKLKRLAPLAMAARNHPESATALYELTRSWSSGELAGKASIVWRTPGGNGLTGEEVFDDVWLRFLEGGYTGTPVTLGTIFYDAMQVGWDPEDQFKIINVAAGEDA